MAISQVLPFVLEDVFGFGRGKRKCEEISSEIVGHVKPDSISTNFI